MKISQKSWKSYIDKLSKIDKTAAEKVAEYYRANPDISMNELIYYAYNVSSYYGEAAGELACEMYDEVATTAKRVIPPAEPARTATYGEIAGAVASVLSYTKNADAIGAEVGKSVKKVSLETIKNNALRDGAEFAWVPSGDTCAFCIMLASNGWRRASKKAIRGGHKEHVHSNCDCTYAVRFDPNTEVEGYDPEYYLDIYDNAEGYSWQDKVNSIRRDQYAKDPEKYRVQKRLNYAKNKEKQYLSLSITNLQDELVGKSLSAKATNYDILDLATGTVYHLVENTKLQNKEVFAGKGTQTIYRDAWKYANKFPQTKAEDWQHVKAIGTVATSDGDIMAEIHWSQCEGVGKVDMFVKKWLE